MYYDSFLLSLSSLPLFSTHSGITFTHTIAHTEPPDCPSDLKVQEIESRSIVLTWGHPFSGHSPLTNYIIEYREEQDGRQMDGKLFKEIIESRITSFHMQRLLPHTSYLIRVFAQNALGVSPTCPPLRVTTDREAPSSAPRYDLLPFFVHMDIVYAIRSIVCSSLLLLLQTLTNRRYILSSNLNFLTPYPYFVFATPFLISCCTIRCLKQTFIHPRLINC